MPVERTPRRLPVEVVLLVVAIAGIAAIVAAAVQASGASSAALALPYLLSGGIGGIALTGFALGVLAIQARRRVDAADHERTEAILRALARGRAERAPS
jgi:hypothetical protein